MKKAILFGILIIVLALVIAACAPAATQAPASDGNTTTSGSTADGKAIVEAKCTQCHTLQRVTSATKSEADWTKTVNRMMGKGLKLDDAEKQAVIAYLAETYK